MKRQQPEKAEQRAILDLLALVNAEVWVLGHPSPANGRTHRGTGQTAGICDVLAFVPAPRTDPRTDKPDVLLMIEAKGPKGRLSLPQWKFRNACLRANVSHVVGGVDAVLAWLRSRGHRV